MNSKKMYLVGRVWSSQIKKTKIFPPIEVELVKILDHATVVVFKNDVLMSANLEMVVRANNEEEAIDAMVRNFGGFEKIQLVDERGVELPKLQGLDVVGGIVDESR